MRRPALILALCLVAGCSSGSPSSSPSASVSPPSAVTSSPAPSPSVPTSASPTGTAPGALPPLPVRNGPPRLALVARFDQPVYVTAPPDDPRLFVVEQPGRIMVVKDGRTLPAPFLDIRDIVLFGGERGLLSMAFAPDYATSRTFYVDHNARDGDVRVAAYRVGADPDRADAGSRRELLRVAKPYPNHNGGLLLFDKTGMLIVGTGDGGSANDPGNRAQDLGVLQGKLLRIDPHPSGGRPYGIPPDNPFASGGGARPEVWAYGLRNPWRFSFDAPTGNLYVGDVGQDAVEEVDVVPPARQAGANYGWRVFEGRRRVRDERLRSPDRVVTPVHTFGHDSGHCSVTGGVVYDGSVAALRGRYVFGEYCTGDLWSFPAGTADRPAVTRLPFRGGQTTSFGIDARGEVYVCSAGGEVWRITA
jgi:glucose/arabinose dehydrogenase